MAELTITSVDQLDEMYARVGEAFEKFKTFSQEQVDKIFKAAAMAACCARLPLAKMAVEEGHIGLVEDKVIKNNFASEYIYNKYKHLRTCGVIEEDVQGGFVRIAEPLGIIVGVTPCTNPTSTAIFKVLLALKTRNCFILSPHPRTAKSTIEACRICYQAAVAAGAPEYCISWVSAPTLQMSLSLMKHPKTALILATGGGAMVKSAYSSGNPAIGVGPGNCPAVIDEYADVDAAVSKIIMSKSFDYGVICASENTIVAHESQYEAVLAALKKRGALVLTPEQKDKMADVLFNPPTESGFRPMNAATVGLAPAKLLEIAGIEHDDLPAPRLIIGPVADTKDIWCHEKLAPCCSLINGGDWSHCIETAIAILHNGGCGHTATLHTGSDTDTEGSLARRHIKEYEAIIPANRVLVNSPAAQGAIGDLWNFRLNPSLTLGCGSEGGNSESENIAPFHLLNVKSVAIKRENMLWFRVPPRIFFKKGCLGRALQELKGKKRALLITGKVTLRMGFADRVIKPLQEMGIRVQNFSEVEPDPTLRCAKRCAEVMKEFQPDVIIAMGGGSAMDLMKIARLLYEHPEEEFKDLAARFMDILKRIHTYPDMFINGKTLSVCIPTTSGTGAEVTPFAVITDSDEGVKYPLADYELLPHMAIIDSDLTLTMPAGLCAFTGLDALTHALEAYVSVMATPFTQSYSLQAIKMVFENLAKSVNEADPDARDAMHEAACIAGMAFGNAFLGINHSLAHKIGQKWHIPHGLANAQVMTHVIRYNASEKPYRMGVFPQYQFPVAVERYAEVARYIGLGDADTKPAELVEMLCDAIDELMKACHVSPYVCDSRGAPTREDWMASVDELAEYAFDDQCTGANPRYPLIGDLADILRCIYSPEGDDFKARHRIE